MFDKFLKLIHQYSPLTKAEAEFIEKNIPIKIYAKNELFFEEGTISQTIYFVLEGCVRQFYNVEGKEKTAYFYAEGKFICAGESYNFNIPAIENFQALEGTTLMLFHKPMNDLLLKTFPNFELIARYATEDELISCKQMIASFVTKSPQQRYLELLVTNKELFQRVDQQYIASYLGISPESLSRIKKRIVQPSNQSILNQSQE